MVHPALHFTMLKLQKFEDTVCDDCTSEAKEEARELCREIVEDVRKFNNCDYSDLQFDCKVKAGIVIKLHYRIR